MAFSIRIENGIFTVTSEGDFEFEEALGALRDGIEEARGVAAASGRRLPILMDIRQSAEQRSSDQLREIAEAIGGGQDALDARCAIVVLSPYYHGMSRMFSVFAEWAGVEVKLFPDPGAAREWLAP